MNLAERKGCRPVSNSERSLAARSLYFSLSQFKQWPTCLSNTAVGHETETDTVRKQKMYNELGCVSCSVLPFCFSDRPPKISSQEDFIQKEHRFLLDRKS